MKTKRKPPKPGIPESFVLEASIEAFAIFGVEVKRRNVAGFKNQQGQYVACNEAGDSDLYGTFPQSMGPAAGKSFACEIKRGGFDPRKVRGKELERFELQVEKLRDTNEAGGYGWWVNDASQILHVLQRLREGWRIVIEEGFPWVTDE